MNTREATDGPIGSREKKTNKKTNKHPAKLDRPMDRQKTERTDK